MKTMTCDFLIVGAGLSGCTLGVLLARAGADVLALELLDAKEKDKPCAGGIDRNLRSLLEETFGRGAWDDLHPAHIDGMRFRMDGHELRGGSRFCALPRKQLDDYALNLYTEAGGRLMDRVSVKAIDAAKGEAACECLRTGEPFTVQFRTVVGADGAASCARRLITGKKASAAPAIEASVPKLFDELLLEHRYGEVGYAWYIPQRESATVGAWFRGGSVALCREALGSLLRELSISVEPKAIRGAFIPSGDDVLLRAGENAYFVGDAAGLIHATLGGGIHYAIESAQLLASALTGGQDYGRAMRSIAEDVAMVARNAEKIQFLTNFRILKKGLPASSLTRRWGRP